MKAITEFIVRVTDLLEAEGRSLRSALRTEGDALKGSIGRFAISFAFLIAAAPLLIAGLCLVCAAVYLWIGPVLGPAWAALITGVVTLAVAGGLILAFKKGVDR